MSDPKIMIAIPVYDKVEPDFMASLFGMAMPKNTKVAMEIGSIIHIARDRLLRRAMDENMDYIMWLDSDMTFGQDTLVRLLDDAEGRKPFVSGIAFTRSIPTRPVFAKKLTYRKLTKEIKSEPYLDYPEDSLFQVEAVGLAVALIKVDMLKQITLKYRESPFEPLPGGMGEDWSMCWKARQCGFPIWCDSRVKTGHIGKMVYDEKVWQKQGGWHEEDTL